MVKKGRHRRYEEARALKHTSDELDILFEPNEEPCAECGAMPEEECVLVRMGYKPYCEFRDRPDEKADDAPLFPS